MKVMQTIYTLSTLNHEMKQGEPVKLLLKHFDQSKELLTYITFFLTEVARYAETDSYVKSSKHLPSKEDLNINTKIAGNTLLWKIKESGSFQTEIAKSKPERLLDKELVKKIYSQLAESTEYKRYISTEERNSKDEKEILEYILNELMLENDLFISHIEENFINWDDDSEMVASVLRNDLQKPGSVNFSDVVGEDKLSFAKTLLTTFMEKEEHLESYIIPKLKNWDRDRIAALDMIIMKMGVAEFLYFETIPPKVTINEYIDIAKEYSTQQSGQFVNGILDNIHKELVADGKLNKKDFKKQA